jgi:hypothetical protein
MAHGMGNIRGFGDIAGLTSTIKEERIVNTTREWQERGGVK